MRAPTAPATAASLLAAVLLAIAASLVLARMPLALGSAVAAGLVVLVVAVAHIELALYVLIFSMLLSPEVVVGDLGRGATLGRGLTLRFDDGLVLLVGLAWLARAALDKEAGLFARTPLNPPIAAYGLATVLATGLGIIGGRVTVLGGSLYLLKYIEYFVVYFVMVNHLRERGQFRRLLVALLLTVAVASLIGMGQIPSGERVSAPFEGETGEPNTFGGYLVLMLAVVAGLYLTSVSAARKLLLAGMAALILLPVLFTLSRASYVALIPMAAALFVFGDRKPFLALVFAVLLALGPLVVPEAVVDRVVGTFPQSSTPDQIEIAGIRVDASASARLHSWYTAVFEDWPRHPVFGYGVTGHRFLDAQYPRVLLEAGGVGLLAFLWLQVTLFREARAVLKATRDPLFKGVALGFLAGFVGLVGHSLGANTFIIVRIMEPFWLLAGMVMTIPRLEAAETARDSVAARMPARVHWRQGAGQP